MDEIIKALKELEKALERNEMVSSISVTIRLKKPKPTNNKAKEKA